MSRERRERLRRAGFLVGLAVLLVATQAGAQEAQYFDEPPAKPHFQLFWDFLARFDHIDHLYYYPPITRGRFELRPQVDFVISDEFRLGVRGVFDYGTEPNIDNALYEDNYISRAAYLDRYFLLWTPGAWTVRAGAFAQPIVASEMLWDHDIQTPGAAVSYAKALDASSSLTVTAAGFYSAQHYRDESLLGVGQVVWNRGEPGRFAIQTSASFWNLDMRDLDPQYYRENRVTLVNGHLAYQSKFELLDLLVRLQFPVCALPVTISLDYIHNFGAVAGKGHNAYEVGLTVGAVGTPRNWRAFFVYQYIGRDALVGAYNTDDWWWHTWAEGYRFGFAYTILPRVYLQPAFVVQRRLDSAYWIQRVTVDLVKMF